MENASLITSTPERPAQERISQSLKFMVDEAQQLLKNAQRTSHDQLSAARDKLETQLRSAQAEVVRLEENALQQVKRAAHATDHAVHEHPYASMGVAAGVGVLLGMLIARR